MLTLTKVETDYGVEWVNADVEDPFENPQTDFNDPTHEFTDTDMAVLKLDYDRVTGVVGAYYSDLDSESDYQGNRLISPADASRKPRPSPDRRGFLYPAGGPIPAPPGLARLQKPVL